MALDQREILDFLYSASTRIVPTVCPDCGTWLEPLTAKFFWSGQNWEVSMPNCPKCNPESNHEKKRMVRER
jgi:hypothetical protein